MRVLRLTRGVTRLDRLRNTRVREDLQVEPLLDSIEKGKLRWYGHVMKMEEQRIPKRYFEWTPTCRRPVGRPRMRWLRGVEDAIERRGSTLHEEINRERYNNRTEWRSFVKSPPN